MMRKNDMSNFLGNWYKVGAGKRLTTYQLYRLAERSGVIEDSGTLADQLHSLLDQLAAMDGRSVDGYVVKRTATDDGFTAFVIDRDTVSTNLAMGNDGFLHPVAKASELVELFKRDNPEWCEWNIVHPDEVEMMYKLINLWWGKSIVPKRATDIVRLLAGSDVPAAYAFRLHAYVGCVFGDKVLDRYGTSQFYVYLPGSDDPDYGPLQSESPFAGEIPDNWFDQVLTPDKVVNGTSDQQVVIIELRGSQGAIDKTLKLLRSMAAV